MIIPGISLQYSIYSLGLYTSASFYIFTGLTMIILGISPQYSFCSSVLYTTCFTSHTALSKLHNSIHPYILWTVHWDTHVRKTNKMHTFLHNVFLDADTLRMIVSATRLRLRCTVKYYKRPVQNSSWWWTIIWSKHVEENLSELNEEKCATCWLFSL